MKLKITTTSNKSYNIIVKSKNFDEIIEKILESKYIRLNENTIVLTSAIIEIEKIN